MNTSTYQPHPHKVVRCGKCHTYCTLVTTRRLGPSRPQHWLKCTGCDAWVHATGLKGEPLLNHIEDHKNEAK